MRFRHGDEVQHGDFGTGRVIAQYLADETVVVEFEGLRSRVPVNSISPAYNGPDRRVPQRPVDEAEQRAVDACRGQLSEIAAVLVGVAMNRPDPLRARRLLERLGITLDA